MPELPEVETVRRGLEPHLVGRRLQKVLLRRENLRQPLPAALDKQLKGRLLLRIERRAKYLLFHFEGARILIVHLGMSGKLVLKRGAPEPYLKHDHVILFWDNHDRLVFNDARRFGLMVLTMEAELKTHPLLAGLGPEPLEENWDGESLFTMLEQSRAPVKTVLMDQRRLVGVGNIYACEGLFRARIHPARPAEQISRKKAVLLAKALKQVLEEAIASGGSTLRDYVRSSGDAGYFQHHFAVYGRAGKPCPRCAKPIQTMRQAGRSTFFCGHCQRESDTSKG